jgi:hypothetical protein
MAVFLSLVGIPKLAPNVFGQVADFGSHGFFGDTLRQGRPNEATDCQSVRGRERCSQSRSQ